MYKIQTLNKISPLGLNRFPHEDYEVASEFTNPDAIVVRSFKMHDMELPSNLKAIARAGAGVNNIPIDKCSDRGIVVFNTPGANANAVKEAVLGAMFLSARDIIGGVNWVQSIADKGDEVPALVEKEKSNFAGTEIKGKTLGVIGLGAIGAMVANDAIALGMDVIGYDPYISVEAAWTLSSQVQKATGLETMLSQVDYITIHVPLMEQTKNMINREKFAMMRDGVKIINFARGGLVHNEDLKEAIASGKVSCYVTDFPDASLLNVKGVIPIPHLGASTAESEENCAVMAVEQVKEFLEKGNIKNSVNYPNCSLPRVVGDKRVVISNKNIPNMISEITSLLADHNINICDMINKSRGDLAYNIIDIEGDLSEDVLQSLKNIEGIITVRVID
jgi:D-3-phosphoglycerate dehydrogenase